MNKQERAEAAARFEKWWKRSKLCYNLAKPIAERAWIAAEQSYARGMAAHQKRVNRACDGLNQIHGIGQWTPTTPALTRKAIDEALNDVKKLFEQQRRPPPGRIVCTKCIGSGTMTVQMKDDALTVPCDCCKGAGYAYPSTLARFGKQAINAIDPAPARCPTRAEFLRSVAAMAERTGTGRTSSTKPNMANVPKRDTVTRPAEHLKMPTVKHSL